MLKILVTLFFLLLGNVGYAANELAASAEQVRPVLLGSKLPEVSLTTIEGSATTLKEQVAGKPTLLVFYRGGWCPYCNLQLSELRLLKDDLEKLGYQIIAVSPDRADELKTTIGKQKLDYTLLSDSKANAIRAFGIGYQLDDAAYKKYQGYGVDLEKASGGEKHHALPVPSVFIVDSAGVLQFSFIHPDYTVRIPGAVVLEAAKAIAGNKQFVKGREKAPAN